MSAPTQEVVRHPGQVDDDARHALFGHRPATLWLTGLSGAGKSTLAYALEARLTAEHHACCVLDGDNLRHGINRDLGFTDAARRENLRRVAEVAKLMNDAGLIAIAALVSPFDADRALARDIVGPAKFLQVHVATPLACCESRDPKGFYRRARAGSMRGFTGIEAPYEAPADPALVLDTSWMSVNACVDRLCRLLEPFGIAPHTAARAA
ncbi:adenylyl-sulfate kinase [Trinickia fusca]|uniref:Adenylyl-sulfate kinase n=1 Tax=Trinickia fusca TaxID=2419777 RepID=A0A494X8Z1_9BURK|nr:adenylyl-sulfate kinase [Trinickia fusca]RKP44549.1 adenylyl-sulfate kinase [Trinickia fusca]